MSWTLESDAIVVADSAGVIRLWSPGAEAAFGHAGQAAVGQTLVLVVPPEFREAHSIGFRRAVETGHAEVEGQDAPFPVQCADGAIVTAMGRLTLMRGPGGRVVAATVVFEPPGPR